MKTVSKMTGGAAALLLAALLLLPGCAMKRDIVQVEAKVDSLRTEQQQTYELVHRLDSLLNSETEASVQLRAEIRSALSDLSEQSEAMRANMNDLQDKVNMIAQNQGSRISMNPPVTTPSPGDTSAIHPAPQVDCQTLYDDSYINLKRNQYDDAIKGFRDYLKYCGDRKAAPDARFWIGEAYYSMEKYKDALNEFEFLLKDYPKTDKRPSVLYKMGLCHEELGQKKDARFLYKKLIDEFPDSFIAGNAKEKLKELK